MKLKLWDNIICVPFIFFNLLTKNLNYQRQKLVYEVLFLVNASKGSLFEWIYKG